MSIPSHYSIPSLIVLDSAMFSLCEVTCPKGAPSNRVFSRLSKPWNYKVLSSFFFRVTANALAINKGVLAPLTGHVL